MYAAAAAVRMNMHTLRRGAVAASLLVLIALGVQHPGNATLRPAMVFAASGALFASVTVGLAAYFEYGSKIVRSFGRFLLHSEVVVLLAGIFVLSLTMLGAFVSWNEMVGWQMTAYLIASAVGLLAAFREYLAGVDLVPVGGQPH